jgi:hypothetical protein
MNVSKAESEAMLKDNRKITDSNYLSVNNFPLFHNIHR